MSLPPSASYAQIRAATIAATLATRVNHQRQRELIERIDRAVVTCESANLAGVTEVPRDVADLVADLQARTDERLFVPRTIADALTAIDDLADLLLESARGAA